MHTKRRKLGGHNRDEVELRHVPPPALDSYSDSLLTSVFCKYSKWDADHFRRVASVPKMCISAYNVECILKSQYLH